MLFTPFWARPSHIMGFKLILAHRPSPKGGQKIQRDRTESRPHRVNRGIAEGMHTHRCLLSLEPASSTRRGLISDRPLPDPPGLQLNKDSDAIQHPFGMTGPTIDLFPLGFVWNESIRGAPMFGPLCINADACLARWNLELFPNCAGRSSDCFA